MIGFIRSTCVVRVVRRRINILADVLFIDVISLSLAYGAYLCTEFLFEHDDDVVDFSFLVVDTETVFGLLLFGFEFC